MFAQSLTPYVDSPSRGCIRGRAARRGATLVESALVLSLFLFILIGTLDLGMAWLKQNMLAEGAIRVARQAIVRGEMSPGGSAWGPRRYGGTADDDTEIAAALRPALVTIDPRRTKIEVEWLDGGNRLGQRVKVKVAYGHRSIFPLSYGMRFNLGSESVMRIAH